MKIRRFPLILSALILVTSSAILLGCSKKEATGGSNIRLAFITTGVASFWTIAKFGAEAAGKELGDADAPNTDRLAYIGMDNYLAGRMLGQLIQESLPQGGKLAIFVGRVEQDNARKRRQGTIDQVLGRSIDSSRYDPPGTELTNGTYTFVVTLTDQFDRVKAKANCEDAVLRYPDLAGIVGLFAYNAPLCLEALKQTQKVGTIKVFSFDEADETLQGIKDGSLSGTIVQNPYEYGFQSIKLLKEIVAGNNQAIPPSRFIDIPARRIDRSSVDAFWSDLKKKTGRS